MVMPSISVAMYSYTLSIDKPALPDCEDMQDTVIHGELSISEIAVYMEFDGVLKATEDGRFSKERGISNALGYLSADARQKRPGINTKATEGAIRYMGNWISTNVRTLKAVYLD
jgi:hypothetical protein